MAKKFKELLNKKIETNEEFKEEWVKGENNRKIVNQVIEIRLKLGLTQRELAQKMKTSQSYISRVENGNLKIGLPFLERFANSLGLDIETKITIPNDKKIA